MAQYSHLLQAQKDLLEIWQYIAQDNPDAADKILDRIDKKCRALADYPYMGREREDIHLGLYSFPVNNYVIFYRPAGDGIEIVRVLHGARDVSAAF